MEKLQLQMLKDIKHTFRNKQGQTFKKETLRQTSRLKNILIKKIFNHEIIQNPFMLDGFYRL